MTNINKSNIRNWPFIVKLQKTSSSLLAVHFKVMMKIIIKRRHYHSLNNYEKSLKPQAKITGT